MSHVDEGALHAYLDGALDEYPVAEAQLVREHLDECAACRERLESEREIRGEAASILGLAAPEVTVPSLEELRAYVRANAPRRSPMSVRIYRVGWAASVMLALGTGWMLRGGQAPVMSPTGVSLDQVSPQEVPAAFDAAESDVAQLEQSVEEVPAEAGSQVRREAQSVPTDRVEAARQEAAPVTLTADADQPTAAAPPELDDLPAPLDVVTDLEIVAELPLRARSVPEVMPEVVGRRAAAAPAVPTTSAQAADQLAAEPLAEPLAELLAEREAERVTDDAGAGAAVEPELRSASGGIVTSANIGAPAVGLASLGRTVEFGDTRDDVTADEESYSLVVPNLVVIDVLFRGTGVRAEGQVVRQRLESGDTLKVIHLPPEMDPAEIEAPRPGDTELVVQRAAGWIVMRAPVDEEALLELLERLLDGR